MRASCVLVPTTVCPCPQGNAESNNLDTGAGSMEAICKALTCPLSALHPHFTPPPHSAHSWYSASSDFGSEGAWGHGSGKGPWIMAGQHLNQFAIEL